GGPPRRPCAPPVTAIAAAMPSAIVNQIVFFPKSRNINHPVGDFNAFTCAGIRELLLDAEHFPIHGRREGAQEGWILLVPLVFCLVLLVLLPLSPYELTLSACSVRLRPLTTRC